jgi:hypothetical protein
VTRGVYAWYRNITERLVEAHGEEVDVVESSDGTGEDLI